MISALLFDFARVFLFAKEKDYEGELNALHRQLSSSLDYKFFDHFEFNEELFGYVEQLKAKIDLYMFTSGTIQETPEVQIKIVDLFKEIFSAQKLCLSKTDPRAYIDIAASIGKAPEEILFIDDTPANILAAQEAHLSTILYSNNLQLMNDLKNFVNFTI
jgi:HAD superfamily hydrolase (TIGR01509 family)